MQPTQHHFSIWYFLLTFVVLLLFQFLLFAPHSENLSYRDFKTFLKAGKVEDLALGERTITGRLKTEGLEGLLPAEKIKELQQMGKGEHRFVTVKVDDSALTQELEASGIQFRGRVESNWFSTLLSWILPALIFFGIWGVVMRRIGGASGLMAIGKSKAEASHLRVRETLTAKHGMLEALAKLLIEREVVDRDALSELLAGPRPE